MSRDQAEITAELREQFKVTCAKCGSDNVVLDDSLGYSDYTGRWGSVDLMCKSCPNAFTIVDTSY